MEIGDGAGLPSGTVHPILARLEGRGWLDSRWEEIDPTVEGRPARRYYRLTADGAEAARQALASAYQAKRRHQWALRSPISHEHADASATWAVARVGAVRLAVRALPPGPTRDRYRHEFLAELYGMSSTRQMRHAAHLLSRSLVLRAAVNREQQSSTLELIMPVVAPRKRSAVPAQRAPQMGTRRLNPDREVYLQCKHCGKDSTTSSDPAGRISEATSLASVADSDSPKITAAAV